MRVTGLFVVAAALAVGCARDPLGECTQLSANSLVITEFRGPQTPDDTLGVWVEMFNASAATLDLEGAKVRFRKKDGSSEVAILVRRSVPVAPGSYVVLGLVPDEDRPSYIDYGFSNDFHVGFLAAAAVDVESCSDEGGDRVRVDRAVYDVLPKIGTYSLGSTPPDANNNDVPAMWCNNAASMGTPQQANPPCP